MQDNQQKPTFSVKECLWLCLPALLIGAVLRLCFMQATPEVYYGGDSNSYFTTAENLWLKGSYTLPAKRQYIYPLLLVPTPLVPYFNIPQVVAAVQHLVGLVTIVGVGWIVGHLVRRPKIWVVPVTILAAILPRMLWYEHEMIAESLLLSAYIWAVALAFPTGALLDRKRLFWFLIATGLIIALKPHGKPIWFALLVAAALITGSPWRWGWRCFAVIAVCGFMLVRGGSQSQGAWLFLNSTLPFVNTEGEHLAPYRAMLKPSIDEIQTDLGNYPFNQKNYKKTLSDKSAENPLGKEWAQLVRDREKFTMVAKSLAKEAVLNHPVEYARLVLRKIGLALSSTMSGKKFTPAEFWRRQGRNNDGRWEKEKTREAKPMEFIYGMDEAAYNEMVKSRSTRSFWLEKPIDMVSNFLQWTTAKPGAHGEAADISPRAIGWLVLFGLLCCLTPKHFIQSSVLWLPPVLYLVAIFSVGDSVTRYVHPVEWIGVVLIAIALDRVIDFLSAIRARLRPGSPASEEPSTKVASVS